MRLSTFALYKNVLSRIIYGGIIILYLAKRRIRWATKENMNVSRKVSLLRMHVCVRSVKHYVRMYDEAHNLCHVCECVFAICYIHHFNIIDLGSVNKLTNNPPCKTMTFFKMAIITRSHSKSTHMCGWRYIFRWLLFWYFSCCCCAICAKLLNNRLFLHACEQQLAQ